MIPLPGDGESVWRNRKINHKQNRERENQIKLIHASLQVRQQKWVTRFHNVVEL